MNSDVTRWNANILSSHCNKKHSTTKDNLNKNIEDGQLKVC